MWSMVDGYTFLILFRFFCTYFNVGILLKLDTYIDNELIVVENLGECLRSAVDEFRLRWWKSNAQVSLETIIKRHWRACCVFMWTSNIDTTMSKTKIVLIYLLN